MNNPSNLNLANPFASDSTSAAVQYTNPSPFKLFKSQTPSLSSIPNNSQPQPISTVPISSSFSQVFSNANPFSASNMPNSTSSQFFSNPSGSRPPQNNNFSSSQISNQQAKNSLFTGNKELENKKNQILNKKRIQDILDEWKHDFKENLQNFNLLAEKTANSEKSLKEIQKEVVLLQEFYLKIKVEQKKMEENIEMVLAEQNDLNGALDIIDKELEKVLQSTGIYSGFDDKENLYKQCNFISKSIDFIENNCTSVIRVITEKNEENREEHDLSHTIDIFLGTLEWIEKSVECITEKMVKIEKDYKYML